MNESWTELLKAYFSVRLTEAEETLWHTELTGSTKTDSEELCEVVRWATGRDRSKYDGKPTLKDLRIWVYTYRKRNGIAGDQAPEIEGCGLCLGSGWLVVHKALPEDAGHMDQLTDKAGVSSVPCRCTKGQGMFEICSEYLTLTPSARARIDKLSDLAVKQASAANRDTLEPTGTGQTAARAVARNWAKEPRQAAAERREAYVVAQRKVGR